LTLQQRTPLKRTSELKRTPIKRKAVPKKRKPKRPTSTDYKRWCDQLFSQIVRARGACLRCDKTFDLQCSHIVSRGYLATRWDETNAIVACKGCHHWQHMNPLENEAWLTSINIDTLRLKHLALTHAKPDYPATFARLIERADELGIPTEKFKKHLPSVT
jgi:5-methylcytosine-specific restriction endonuclease McrA